MSIVTSTGLIFNMSRVDGNSTSTLFRCLIDLVVSSKLGQILFCQYFRNCSSQSGLSMIDVSNRSNIQMGLLTIIGNTSNTSKSRKNLLRTNYPINTSSITYQVLQRMEQQNSSQIVRCSAWTRNNCREQEYSLFPRFYLSPVFLFRHNPVRMMQIIIRVFLLLSILCSAEIIQGYVTDAYRSPF